MGFDNFEEAQREELTSYDFNTVSMAHAMLWFVRNPPRTRAQRAQARMEIRGLVIPRATTAPPRRLAAVQS